MYLERNIGENSPEKCLRTASHWATTRTAISTTVLALWILVSGCDSNSDSKLNGKEPAMEVIPLRTVEGPVPLPPLTTNTAKLAAAMREVDASIQTHRGLATIAVYKDTLRALKQATIACGDEQEYPEIANLIGTAALEMSKKSSRKGMLPRFLDVMLCTIQACAVQSMYIEKSKRDSLTTLLATLVALYEHNAKKDKAGTNASMLLADAAIYLSAIYVRPAQ